MSPRIAAAANVDFETRCDVLVIGAGACGLVAALRAADAGADVIVVERDHSPTGSTSMSSGFIPAAATRFQAALGITDSAERFSEDIQRKAGNEADPAIVEAVTREIGPALEWLADSHGLDWLVLTDFLYPGHSVHRMHAVPEKTGAGLMARLLAAAEAAAIPIVTDAHATTLFAEPDGTVAGLETVRPDGAAERIGCGALVLACNGYGGNRDLVRQYIPAMADAPYYGHPGNEGDAVLWGGALGAATRHLGACQGHGSLAHPHGVLITWALMMEGGIQVNVDGARFSNEHQGYSEQAIRVLEQPGGIAWDVYDGRLHELGLAFPDYRDADSAGAILGVDTVAGLAALMKVPAEALENTLADVERFRSGAQQDPFGRDFTGQPGLKPPYHAVRVTGALFHTQGGLVVDGSARVRKADGAPVANLFAGGGAACGVSGSRIEGYLSGNGLLTAVALGSIAGRAAADRVGRSD
ncbi:FAD-dependent oxidoreductase [Microbaculum sp. FT89]|uniref:FAD-dependent oxidoreductase n=1 Tax=Microbaculum sp. FT89 TaxID=3447298 RepID=UPI003F5302A9